MIVRVQSELNSDMCENDIEQVDSAKVTELVRGARIEPPYVSGDLFGADPPRNH